MTFESWFGGLAVLAAGPLFVGVVGSDGGGDERTGGGVTEEGGGVTASCGAVADLEGGSKWLVTR
jgi:hypothetical protein